MCTIGFVLFEIFRICYQIIIFFGKNWVVNELIDAPRLYLFQEKTNSLQMLLPPITIEL